MAQEAGSQTILKIQHTTADIRDNIDRIVEELERAREQSELVTNTMDREEFWIATHELLLAAKSINFGVEVAKLANSTQD